MATTKEVLPANGAWVELAVGDFYVENPGPIPLFVTIQANAPTVPDPAAPYHVLLQGDTLQLATSQTCYGRSGSTVSEAVAVITI